jgi:predicted phosphoribosyltransferase
MVVVEAPTCKREYHIATGRTGWGLTAPQTVRHSGATMLCLAVPVCALDSRLAVSNGVGIELISILPF